jgi:DNA polymerase-2
VPEGFILQPTYRVRDGVPVVQLYGRLADGRPFRVEDDRFRPYFFVRVEDTLLLQGEARARVEACPWVDFSGAAVAKIVAASPSAVPALREILSRAGRPTFEADIRFPYRFLIDAGVRAAVSITGPELRRDGLVHFENPSLSPCQSRPELRVLSLDLETDPEAREIRSVALVGDGIDEVHIAGCGEVDGAVAHPDERSMLHIAARRIRDADPDILTGWNVVDFDLKLWVKRGEALGERLHLGRVPGDVLFHQQLGFTRDARATVPGRVVLDGLSLVRDALRLDDYRLESAAQRVLGRGKKIAEVADPAAEIDRLYREEPAALVAYNREDARLVLDILEHESLLALAVERSLLSGMQLDRVGASIASFDLLYLPELRRRGVVAPSVDSERPNEHVRGGAVLDSVPGLFSEIAVYDWKSLYPSLIRTFQLDPLAHARAGIDAIEAPGGARFAREGAILPGVIERFMERRDAAKARGDRHADQALKIMMNALFGVLGTPSCRFFDPSVANAITGFGQEILRRTREAFAAEGVDVIYGDTDSVFVRLEGDGGTRADAARLRDRVQERVASWVAESFGVASHLELELERIYERFFMPRVRGGKSGSKKRYAGRCDDTLEIVGLESVRRDSPPVAGRLQRGMLERAFADDPVVPFVRETLEAVRRGEHDAELVYTKRIRKGSLDRYTASTPPHVQAARKAGSRAGRVIRYVITPGGPEPVFHGEPLPKDIDRGHYIERVLRPVAESILEALGEHIEDAFGEPRQLGLL